MKLSKSLTSAALAGSMVLGATAALADGMPRYGSIKDAPAPYAAPFSWTGFYVGAHAGYASATEDASTTCTVTCGQAPGFSSLDSNGFIGGVHAGYNFALTPNIIAGVEGDFSWTGIDGSGSDINRFTNGIPVGSGGINWSRDIDWLASVRGRLGYTLSPTMLLYVTGGFAWQRADLGGFDAFAGGCPNCNVGSASVTRTGYTVGGGLEVALDRNWMFRAEYLYYSFDSASLTVGNNPLFPLAVTTFNYGETDIHSVRAGISYKF